MTDEISPEDVEALEAMLKEMNTSPGMEKAKEDIKEMDDTLEVMEMPLEDTARNTTFKDTKQVFRDDAYTKQLAEESQKGKEPEDL